jgi:hypothetical protein
MRRFVCAMAGVRMTHEEIRQLVINPQTGERITKTTLARAFRRELAEGKAKLKSMVATRYYEALGRGDAWATRLGLASQFGWTPDSTGNFVLPPDPNGPTTTIHVAFVKPGPVVEDDDDVILPYRVPLRLVGSS